MKYTPGTTVADLGGRLLHFDLPGFARLIDSSVAGVYFMGQAVVAMLAASLIVGIRCSGTISGERERQTWEALLLTPLEAKQLIRGKLWGIFGAALPCLLVYAVPALVLSLLGGFQAFFWTTLLLAVTLLAMWYVGAAGIFCSVRSRNSWRALLATVGFGYVGGFVVYACTSPVIMVVCIIIYVILLVIDNMFRLGLGQRNPRRLYHRQLPGPGGDLLPVLAVVHRRRGEARGRPRAHPPLEGRKSLPPAQPSARRTGALLSLRCGISFRLGRTVARIQGGQWTKARKRDVVRHGRA
jgi:hypothetical protein